MPRWRDIGKKRWGALCALGLLVVVALTAARGFMTGSSGDLTSTVLVERRELRVSHFEAGEIRAARAEQVTAPRVRGELKIVHLWPEGERVEVGGLILQFDRAETAKRVKDEAGSLERVQADLDKAIAEQERRYTDLAIQVEQRQASLELARIQVQKAEYASPVEQEQRQIRLEQAERALTEAGKNLKARQIVDRVERANLELRITHRQRRYDKAKSDYDRLSVHTTRPGIVVYEKIRKRGSGQRGKVTEGDVVWGGIALLSLPDLSTMQAYSQVGEMDVEKVEVGQQALVRLEAYPGPVFRGHISSIAPMAREHEDAPNVQIFEMTVEIHDQDDRLYPGMSASVEIIIGSLSDVLVVPLSAVARREGQALVYRWEDGKLKPIEVILGRDNGIDVVVESGLEEGERISLAGPRIL